MKKTDGPSETRDPKLALIVDRLQIVEQQLTELKQLAEQHWSAEAQRFALIDQFLSPAMDIDSLIKQLGELGRNQNQLIVQLQGTIERELQAMRSALSLAVGAAGLDAEGQARARGN